MVADLNKLWQEKEDPTPGMKIMIAVVKADKAKLTGTIKSAHQKQLDRKTLTSEEKAALIVEEEERAREERKAREAATEAKRHGIGAQIWSLLGEIW